MEKLIKLFPLLPKKDDVGMAVLGTIFYLIVPGIVATILATLFTLLIITIPLAFVIPLVASAYGIAGIVFVWMSFMGKDIVKK